MRRRVLDLVFLLGVLGKAIDGLIELIGGVVLLIVSPAALQHLAVVLTADRLAENPHAFLANLLVTGVGHLTHEATGMLAAYLLLHGVVKLAIVVALLLGSRRVYPWAIGALSIFLVIQIYELIVSPSVVVAALTALDALIIVLTWREWRDDRTLRETARSTIDWVLRRPDPSDV